MSSDDPPAAGASLRAVPVAIALGSNLGDRDAHLAYGVARLNALLRDLQVSRIYETEPVGVGPQARFLNAAVSGGTTLTARELLDTLLAIETARARERPHPGAPRTLDLDLILFGDAVIDEPGLRVPHPRFRERRFVLEPLAEVAGESVDPETRKSVERLLTDLR